MLVKPSAFVKGCLKDNYDLAVTEDISLEHLDFEGRKPVDFTASLMDTGHVSISFKFPSDDIEILRELKVLFTVAVSMREKDQCEEEAMTSSKEYSLESAEPLLLEKKLVPSATYLLKMSISFSKIHSDWSDAIELNTPEFKGSCAWERCPERIFSDKKILCGREESQSCNKHR